MAGIKQFEVYGSLKSQEAVSLLDLDQRLRQGFGRSIQVATPAMSSIMMEIESFGEQNFA